MAGSILGTEVVRREDGTLLTGEGRYTGDLRPDGLLTAYFVRSPVAHGEIADIDVGAATESPGVVGVFTAATIGVDQVKPRFPLDPHFGRGPLAGDRVRFVGEPVAMVVAETLAEAQDAADEILVDYEPLPVSMDAEAAVGNGAAVLFPERGSDSMVRKSDTALVARGGGTGGSRSAQLGGSAIHAASMEVLDTARQRAAELLEASADDIVVTDEGHLGVAGVPSASVSWEQVAAASDEPLRAELDHTTDGPTFPFGTHISVVEVDIDTGMVALLRHVAVDDAGNLLNPLIVAGQQHGGVASGIGQALYEHVVYDDDGNPLTTGLADYAMPSAAEFCDFTVDSTITPTHLNPLGVKGIGEATTIGATPAVQNAVIDALSDLGIRHIDLPLTPDRVWQAIQTAGDRPPAMSWPSL